MEFFWGPQKEVSVVRNAHQAFPQGSRTLQIPEVKFSLIECIFFTLENAFFGPVYASMKERAIIININNNNNPVIINSI